MLAFRARLVAGELYHIEDTQLLQLFPSTSERVHVRDEAMCTSSALQRTTDYRRWPLSEPPNSAQCLQARHCALPIVALT